MEQRIKSQPANDPPEGYQSFAHSGSFGDCIGPFYFRPEATGGFRYVFRSAGVHANPNGVTHGGALYSFADHITGHAVVHTTKRLCATIKFKVEYLAPAPLDSLIEGQVDLLRVTRTMVFLRVRLFAADRTLMTANGTYKLFAPYEPGQYGAAKPSSPPLDDKIPPVPGGFRPFPNQAAYAELCGPTHYRRLGNGGFINGFQSRALHDNTNKVVHGGVIFTFADDFMGRAASGVARRYATTVAMNVEYLSSGPLDAWIEGTAEISHLDDDLAFVRGRVFHGDRTLLTADGVWRLLQPYVKAEPEAAK
ncbi:MAG: PaaI family thioesterase [Alphaproteobacteria bacterium]|nr:PaaI family thioesterase [Alphaproteobacteria bacterium]